MACAAACPSSALEAASKTMTVEEVLQQVRMDRGGAATVLRCILIPQVNLEAAHALALAKLFGKLTHCRYIELLPYHPYGLSKAEQLGKPGIRYQQPEQSELDAFAAILTEKGIPVKLHGSML